MAKVERAPNGCWVWKGKLTPAGYGRFHLEAVKRPAHVVGYLVFVGDVPEGLELDHLCRNRACVNPKHLEPVTRQVNLLRGDTIPAKNARKTHCSRGHALEGENIRVGPGGRRCRTCEREWARETRARHSNGLGIGGYNRMKTHCAHGHPFDAVNTYVTKAGRRACKACGRERARQKKAA